MQDLTKRGRWLPVFTAQIALAAAVTLAAVLFLATGSSGKPWHVAVYSVSGTVVATYHRFDPNDLAMGAYNDQ